VNAPLPSLPIPDFELIRRLDRLWPAYRGYFRARVEGWERLPEGPALLAANHNGGFVMPEAPLAVHSFHRATGFQDPLVILGHDLAFRMPGVRDLVPRLGAVPARPENARAAFAAGRKVFVYPGGDHDVMRPSRERDLIAFGQRTGFVKVALEAGVPIVPVVAAGAHDVWHVVARGERLARWSGLADSRLRLKVFPIVVSFPWGLTSGFLPFLPFPARVLIEVGEPIQLSGSPEDPADLAREARKVVTSMQAIMDRLAAELRS
jgi:1-acyl-sn-glycerol-3-phosphate acyltransferase